MLFEYKISFYLAFVMCILMSLTLADWFVIQVKVFSSFMITWITSSRPNGLDGHG